KFYSELDKACELAAKAHLQKRKFIQRLMSSREMPLWEIGRSAMDGKPYVELDKATYIIGLIGLNEAVEFLTGKEMHEGEAPFKLGLRIIAHMYVWIKEASKKYNLKFSLEESPAESATRRLAKIDVRLFPEADRFLRGNKDRDERYYTNSIHLRADAPIDLVTRIQLQAKFHRMVESGAIIHAFIGESRPPAASILNLVRKTYYNTEAAQLAISPEFTICNSCNSVDRGLKETCAKCDSVDIYGVTRIVGYFSRVQNWNKSKLGELADRRRGNYAIV
ncbi:MAG: anaerobic ribonucleoside-triphosphate reductase, partial [Planctomycetota bacterium]